MTFRTDHAMLIAELDFKFYVNRIKTSNDEIIESNGLEDINISSKYRQQILQNIYSAPLKESNYDLICRCCLQAAEKNVKS